MGALNTAGKVTFLPDEFPFSEYADVSGQAHVTAERRPHSSQPVTPRGKGHFRELLTRAFLTPNPYLFFFEAKATAGCHSLNNSLLIYFQNIPIRFIPTNRNMF